MICYRVEWLEMKVLFKQMQKKQMKALKVEHREEDKKITLTKGFIAKCLVKVLCSSEDISPEVLKVRRQYNYML